MKNYHVSVKETGGSIVFLRKVSPGAADKSYGIEVAKLAGLPAEVISARPRGAARARERRTHRDDPACAQAGEIWPGAVDHLHPCLATRCSTAFAKPTSTRSAHERQ